MTFGRLAVNDGKLVGRLRLGGRVTTGTVDRVRAFIAGQSDGAVNGGNISLTADGHVAPVGYLVAPRK